VVTIASVADQLAQPHVHTVKPGDTITVSGVAIEAVPAYNTNKKFHPRSAGHVGYIVTVDDARIYHAGDTDLIPEMADFDVNIAMLPVSGTYVMTADEAIQAAERLAPAIAIPMHYGAIVGGLSDAEQFAAGCSMKVVILPRE
jgi:L-ascorbate metabolism protein UlaG (beta-lactamase superfamily)